MTDVFMTERRGGFEQRHKDKGFERAEAETIVTQPQAKKHQESREAGRARKNSILGAFPGADQSGRE